MKLCLSKAALVLSLAFMSAPLGPVIAQAEEAWRPITPTMAGHTIVLTGHDLTIEQLVQIARYGAKVKLSDGAKRMAADSFGLMLEAQAEGVSVYRFNRGAGSTREIETLKPGPPDSPENKEILDRRHDRGGGNGFGYGEEIKDEELGRAMLAVNANVVVYEAASPAFVQGLVDLLNAGVTPASYWRGAIGEADFVPVAATMTGHGFAYYKGERMPSADALAKAGLKPIHLEGNDEALQTTSAQTAGFAALLVNDARELLEWHDVIWSMDLNAMNGSVGPLSAPVQAGRPYKWANYAAARTLDMLKGSYVFNGEHRIIQDPESLRATVWRDGSAWEAWARLRDNALIQMNSTDHNPTVRPGWSPTDSWELNTPQMLKYYVKGGTYSNGKHGYIFSNSNWDPYPLINDVEAFSIPLNNLMVIVVQRMHRFDDTFFTVADANEILRTTRGPGNGPPGGGGGGGSIIDALWQELKPLENPVAPDGVVADRGVGDLDAVPMLKLMRLRQALDVSSDILGQDLQNAAFWLDIRTLENPARQFGPASTAAWTAFRREIPFRQDANAPAPTMSGGNQVRRFMRATSPTAFYASKAVPMPGGDDVKAPLAGMPSTIGK